MWLCKPVVVTLAVIVSWSCLPTDDLHAIQDEFVVAIDVGHSRRVPGATSARGVPEYEFNRNLAVKLHQALVDSGYRRSFLIDETGELDGPDGLKRRTVIARERGADVIVSIHHDSVQEQFLKKWIFDGEERAYSDEFQGYSLIVSTANAHAEKSMMLARLIGDRFLASDMVPTLYHALDIPGERRRLLDERRGIYDIDFWIVGEAGMPAVLIEAGMIVNRDEEARLSDHRYQANIVSGAVQALSTYAEREARAGSLAQP